MTSLNSDKWFNRVEIIKMLFKYYYDTSNGYDKEYFQKQDLNKIYKYHERYSEYFVFLHRQKIGMLPSRKEYIDGFRASGKSKNIYFVEYFYDKYDCIKCKEMLLRMIDKEKR